MPFYRGMICENVTINGDKGAPIRCLGPLAVAPQGSDLAGSVRRNPKDSKLEKLRGLQDADQTGVLVDFGPR